MGIAQQMETHYSLDSRETMDALRRGECSHTTSFHFLTRQNELRLGHIEECASFVPKPPPPRHPSQHARPVMKSVMVAADKCPNDTHSEYRPSESFRRSIELNMRAARWQQSSAECLNGPF